MRRKLNLFFTTSLLLNSSMSLLAFTINANNASINNFVSDNVDIKTATKYANETSIVGKSLLIGKNKGFSTNNLLKDMYNQNHFTHIDNLTGNNTGNDFINDWTSKLDGNSINTIQSLFQRNGINQFKVDDITNNINSYSNYRNILPMVKNYLNNYILSNDDTVNIIDWMLKNIKNLIPNINDYFSYINYIPIIINIINELLAYWDQEDNFSGNTTFEKMQDYMSKKAKFAQAWNIPGHEKWYYIKNEAKNWNWNQFYEYIAGVNFNYMFKSISGKYIGEMISDNIKYVLWGAGFIGFNSDNFNATFSATLNKILTNPVAWPYLIKTIIPLVKSKVLKLTNPTLGIDSITWDDKTPIKNNTVKLKKVLNVFQKLISSKDDMTKLVINLMTGPFGEDIIAKATFAWNDTYWTLPEIQKKFSFISAISDIPQQFVNSLKTAIKNVPINNTINKIFDFTSKYLTTNPLIDLKDLVQYLDLTFGTKDFINALNNLKYIIKHTTTDDISKTKEILEILGVQFHGEIKFKQGSFFSNFSNWLNSPTSSLNSLLNIIVDKTYHNGILDNILKDQENVYKDMYSKYFDINNNSYFTLCNIVMNIFKHNDDSVSAVLSYKIKNNLDNKSYDITFKNDNFLTSKIFKITLFHISQ